MRGLANSSEHESHPDTTQALGNLLTTEILVLQDENRG